MLKQAYLFETVSSGDPRLWERNKKKCKVRNCDLGGSGKKSHMTSSETATFSSHTLRAHFGWAGTKDQHVYWLASGRVDCVAQDKSQAALSRIHADDLFRVAMRSKKLNSPHRYRVRQGLTVQLAQYISMQDSSSIFPTSIQPTLRNLQWLEGFLLLFIS